MKRRILALAALTPTLVAIAFIAVSWLSITMRRDPSCALYHSATSSPELLARVNAQLRKLGFVFAPGEMVAYSADKQTSVTLGKSTLYLNICTENEESRNWLDVAEQLQGIFEKSDGVTLLLWPSSRWTRKGEPGSIALSLPADFHKIGIFVQCVQSNRMDSCSDGLK